MRIRKIEIFGFKSFSDRCVLTIDEPITAVVGPNGCGKSNILDAIRWCMGEQSAKHLRGKTMDDIIFAGSETRPAAGMAEVSLTFENVGLGIAGHQDPLADTALDPEVADELAVPLPDEDADLEARADAEAERIMADEPSPIDFSQYGEVTVTRRLFRDGNSEYLLNKTPCRLRDVTDFFLGTGVGTKAYSIIEQGRVGMIVSSKPEERRLIIEEAAGITKFKKKKQAAERKMDQTRQNLLRVSDIVSELDKQMASLRRQAQKAERYKKYRAEVRDIELWSAAHRTLGFLVEAEFLGGQLAAATEVRDARKAELEAKDAGISADRAELAVEERRLTELTQVVYDLENQVRLAESQIEFQKREAEQAETQARGAAEELEALGQRFAENQEEHARVAENAARLDDQAERQKELLAEAEDARERAREALVVAQGALDEARRDISRAQADIARQEGLERALGKRKDDLEVRKHRVGEELARVAGRQSDVLGEAERIDGLLGGLRQMRLDLGEQKSQLEARLGELKGEERAAADEVDQLRGDLSRSRSRHKALSDVAAKYEGFARGTRAIMKHRPVAEGALVGLLADHVTAPSGLETAVEALLGDRLGAILVDRRVSSAEAIAYLKSHTEGRAAFVALDEPEEQVAEAPAEVPEGAIRLLDVVKIADDGRAAIRPLFADAVVVDDLAAALAAWRPGLGITWVTREGDVVDARGVVSGGSRETAGAGVLEQKREIRELAEKIADLDLAFAEATERHQRLKAEAAHTAGTLEALRKDSHQGEMTILGHEKDLTRMRGEAERANERKVQLEREAAELDGAMAQVVREAEEIHAALEAAKIAADEGERTQLGLIEGVTMARGLLDDETARVTEQKVLAAQAAAERQSVRSQRDRLENEARDLGRRRVLLEDTVQSGGARGEAARTKAEELRVELVEVREVRRARAEELAEGRNLHEQRMAALQVAEASLRTLRSEHDRAASDANRLELRLAQVAADRRHVEESIQERYRLDIAHELHNFHLRAPVTDAIEARLKELRELIERMGEINLTAIEEFEELSKRYEFLTREKADLEMALTQLERAIAKINKTSRKRFRETFDAVNLKFQEIFPRLFRGGRAELRLVPPKGSDGIADGDDQLLDAGVEIFAQPPGKKNTTVELLSGGEKALTAVSLIFAIFLIKPSPFCILDEVDAPLDEANVGRYNDMVREMTDRSQFIVITHNKRTMEIADSLYGITMEEPGSSKLVNVHLRRFGVAKAA